MARHNTIAITSLSFDDTYQSSFGFSETDSLRKMTNKLKTSSFKYFMHYTEDRENDFLLRSLAQKIGNIPLTSHTISADRKKTSRTTLSDPNLFKSVSSNQLREISPSAGLLNRIQIPSKNNTNISIKSQKNLTKELIPVSRRLFLSSPKKISIASSPNKERFKESVLVEDLSTKNEAKRTQAKALAFERELKDFGASINKRIKTVIKNAEDKSKRTSQVNEFDFAKFGKRLNQNQKIENTLLDSRRHYNTLFNTVRSSISKEKYSKHYNEPEHSYISSNINNISSQCIQFASQRKKSMNNFSFSELS